MRVLPRKRTRRRRKRRKKKEVNEKTTEHILSHNKELSRWRFLEWDKEKPEAAPSGYYMKKCSPSDGVWLEGQNWTKSFKSKKRMPQ